MTDHRPEVLFVCIHNAGRSRHGCRVRRGAHHGRDRVIVRSAGTAPADTINPAVVEAMAELGIDLRATGAFPKRLDGLEGFAGRRIDAALADELADKVGRQARPQPQIHGDPDWRRHLAKVEARRGLATVLGV